MTLKEKIKNSSAKISLSRTFIRIFLLLSIFVAIIMSVFSFPLYYAFQDYYVKQVYEEDLKHMTVIDNYLQSIHETLRDYTYYLMDYAAGAKFFMNRKMEPLEKADGMRHVMSYEKWNGTFHSILIYNGLLDTFYTTVGVGQNDSFIMESIENNTSVSVLKPILRELPYEFSYSSDPVFTYLYFDTDGDGDVFRGIVVNANASYICNVFSSMKGTGSDVYIVDSEQKKYVDSSGKLHDLSKLQPDIMPTIENRNGTTGCFIVDDNGANKIISYLVCGYSNWTLLVVEPDTAVIDAAAYIRNLILQIALSVIIICSVVAVLFSNIIYRPFRKLSSMLEENYKKHQQKGYFRDDMKVLEDSVQQIKEYERYKSSVDSILLDNYIKSVLMDDVVKKEQLAEIFAGSERYLLGQPLKMAAVQIYHYRNNTEAEREMRRKQRFALMSLAEKIFQVERPPLALYIRTGFFTILIPVSGNDEGKAVDWSQKSADLQAEYQRLTGNQLCVCIGDEAGGEAQLPQIYELLSKCLEYRVMRRCPSVLFSSEIEKQLDRRVSCDTELESQILNALNREDYENARNAFSKMLLSYTNGNAGDFLQCLTHFFFPLFDKLESAPHEGSPAWTVSFNDVYGVIASFESMDDITGWFDSVLNNLSSSHKETHPHAALISAVEQYIKNNFQKDLGVKVIAAEFKISQNYIASIFRDVLGVSIMDYINNLRLETARKMLAETSMSVSDIILRTGFTSESNFYKLFKKAYNTTPNVYRRSRSILNWA